MSKELDDLLRSAESDNFALNTQPTEQTGEPVANQPQQEQPTQEEDGGIFGLGDTLMAIPRGIVGAGKSAYGLVDALAADALPDWNNNPLGESKTVVGGLVEGISEFATGMFVLSGAVGVAGKTIKGAEWLLNAAEMAKTGKTALSLQGRILAGAATDFVAFDGNSGRLTDLVAKVPGLEEPVNRYLGFLLTDEEDGEVLGRIKNTLEGAGVGAAVDGILKGLRFLKEYRNEIGKGASMEEALKKADQKQSLKDLELTLKMSDDFLFSDGLPEGHPLLSPFRGPFVEEALKGPEVKVTINPDGTPAPIPLSEAQKVTPLLVFHGTSREFSQFDSRFMGTGEGAQAFGWGHYFAENQKVGEAYKDVRVDVNNVSDEQFADVLGIGKRFKHPITGVEFEVVGLEEGNSNYNSDVLVKRVNEDGTLETRVQKKRVASLEPLFQKEGVLKAVDLKASDNEILLWDKPLGESPVSPNIKDTLASDIKSAEEAQNIRGNTDQMDRQFGGIYRNLVALASEGPLDADKSNFANWLRQNEFGTPEETVSRYLESLGVKGHKFLDQGSRGTGGGTFNYVIYGDATPKILGKVEQNAVVPLFVKLSERKPSTLSVPLALDPSLKNWVNQHGTLLHNPLTLIDIDKSTGEASIGILVRPDLIQDGYVRKVLKSVGEAKDLTPAELGNAADEVYRRGKRVQAEFEFAKSQQPEGAAGAGGAEPPKPPAPGAAGPEDFGRSPDSAKGAQQPANQNNLDEHAIFLGEGGFDSNDARAIKQAVGEFTEGVAERGRVLRAFNNAQPNEVFESGEVMAHPVQYTDAVNPRKLTSSQRLGLAIQRSGINLARLKDNDIDIASAVRVVHDMMLATLKEEHAAVNGETMLEMLGRVKSQLDIINGKPSTEEQRIWLARQSKVASENIDNAAAMGFAALEVSVGAVRDIVTTLADMVKRIDDVPDWEWADLAERMGLANDAMQANKSISNSLARGLYLQRAKIEPSNIKRFTANELRKDAGAVNEVLLRHGGRDAIKDMALKIHALGPDVDIRKVSVILNKIEASFGSRTMRLMSDVHYASLLSSIRTHVTTLLSNTFTVLYLPFEEAVGGAWGTLLAKTPEEAKLFKGQMAEAFGTYSAMVTSLPEAIAAAKATFKNTDGVLAPKSTLFDIAGRSKVRGVSAANLGIENPAAAEFADRVGEAMSVFTRALGASDEGFKTLAYRATARTKLLGMGVRAGKSGPELAQFVEESLDRLIYKGQALSQDQLMRRARDEVRAKKGVSGIHATEAAMRLVSEWQKSDWYKELSPLGEFALARAEEGTFTKALRPDSMGNDIKRFLNKHPATKFFVPFVQTPINVMLFAAQRMDFVGPSRYAFETKLLPMAKEWTGNTKLIGRDGSAFAGSRNRFLADMASTDPRVRSSAAGRIILGSAFATFVTGLAMQGLITGRGPADPDERKALGEAGWLPYSFKIGNTYVSYSRLDPFATVLGTMADIQNATKYLPDDKQGDLNELGMGLLVAMANNMTNKTYLQGLSNLISALSDPGAKLERSAQAFVSSFVPNLLRDAGVVFNDMSEGDTAVKEIRSVMDAVLNKTPYFSETMLDPRRNALGEPIKKIQPLGQGSVGALLAYPVPISARSSDDPLLQEMANLEYGFSNPNTTRNGYDMADIVLPNKRSAYDRWLENSSTVRIGGKTLRETLEGLIQNPAYQGLSHFNVSDQKSPRVEVVNSIIQRYRRAAFEKTMQEVPELRAAELNFRARRIAARSGIELR